MSGQKRPGGKSNHEVGGDTVADVLRGALGVREACKAAGLAPEERGAWARAFRRTALRSFDDGLRRVLGRHAWEDDGPVAAEFCGPLAELSVVDLVQALALARRDGVIAVADDGVESRLWCVAGEIVDAESGPLVGEPAVYRMLALERGQVSAELCPVRRARNVERPTPALLLEAARRKDERELLRGRLAGLRFVSTGSGGSPTQAADAALLKLLENPLGIAELVPASGLEEYEALVTLTGLLDAGEVVSVGDDAASPGSLRPVLTSLAGAPLPASRQRLAAALVVGGVAALGALALVAGRETRAPGLPTTNPRVVPTAGARPEASQPAPPPTRLEPAVLPSTAALADPLPSNTAPGVARGAPLPSARALSAGATPAVPTAALAARRRRAAPSRPPSAELRAPRSPSTTPERPTPPVPRMRIIEDHVPHLQIVE